MRERGAYAGMGQARKGPLDDRRMRAGSTSTVHGIGFGRRATVAHSPAANHAPPEAEAEMADRELTIADSKRAFRAVLGNGNGAED